MEKSREKRNWLINKIILKFRNIEWLIDNKRKGVYSFQFLKFLLSYCALASVRTKIYTANWTVYYISII